MLYVGMTNNLSRRMSEHIENASTIRKSFTGQFNCYNLIYWETFPDRGSAYKRERQLKKWSRKMKENLIAGFNPKWRFLNDEIPRSKLDFED